MEVVGGGAVHIVYEDFTISLTKAVKKIYMSVISVLQNQTALVTFHLSIAGRYFSRKNSRISTCYMPL